jgi:hypothetical protein
MKYLGIIAILLFSCQNKIEDNNNDFILNENISSVSKDSLANKKFLDSLYTCESSKFISKLEEIPDRDSNAYRITIISKDGKWKKSKLINTRPKLSRISNCNDLYSAVSFACGGPCYSKVYVFTNDDRQDEQYHYAQEVKIV